MDSNGDEEWEVMDNSRRLEDLDDFGRAWVMHLNDGPASSQDLGME